MGELRNKYRNKYKYKDGNCGDTLMKRFGRQVLDKAIGKTKTNQQQH